MLQIISAEGIILVITQLLQDLIYVLYLFCDSTSVYLVNSGHCLSVQHNVESHLALDVPVSATVPRPYQARDQTYEPIGYVKPQTK